LTSNPSIFEEAISESSAYDEQFAELVAGSAEGRDLLHDPQLLVGRR